MFLDDGKAQGLQKSVLVSTFPQGKHFTSSVASQQDPAELLVGRRSSEVGAHARCPAVRRSLFTLYFIVDLPRAYPA